MDDSDGGLLVFTPNAPLASSSTYTAEVSGAKDLAGNQMSPYSWSFTTGEPDTAAPVVTAAAPGPDATNVPVNTTVKATFNEAVSQVQLAVKDPVGVPVQGALQSGESTTEWTFTPASKLSARTVYRVELSGAKDSSGNVMAPYTWSFTTGADTPPPPSGLVAAYGMNEGSGTGVADASGKNNSGTGSGISWTTGKYGQALSFNGTSSWVTVQDAASLRLTTGMTLSAWVNPATAANWRSVLTKELSTNGASYSLYAANGRGNPSGWVQTSANVTSTVDGTSPLPVGAWNHLALTYNGAALRLFINGQQVAQTTLSESLYDDGSPLRIGGNSVWGEYFSGLIDEVRIYNRAQTAAEIQTDMNTPIGSGTPNPDTTPPTVSSVTPAAQTTGVPVTTTVTATFSEPVAQAQLTLKNPTGTTIAGTTTMDAAQRVLTFTPAQPLADATAYTATVSGAKDTAGNVMTGAHTWAFTTGVKPPTGLVAAYGMNETTGTTVGDFSGNNNTGTALDTTRTTGKYGSALSFNGSSSWVTIQHAASLRLTNALTLSAWVRPATADTLWRAVLMKERSTGGGYGLYASSEYNAPAGWLETNQEGGALTGDDPLPANQWSHLATTYDGSTLRLYINGTLAAQAPIAGDVLDDGGPLRIGGNGFWGEYYSGLIDEVRIYNRAQTAAEIQTDMNTPIGTAAAPRTVDQTSRTDAPTIEKLTVDSGSLAPRLTTWISGQRRDKTKIEVEVSNRPTKTLNSAKITKKAAEDDLLIWSGQANARPGDSRVTLQVPKDRLSKGANVRWRARIAGGSWADWQNLSIAADARALTTATTAAYPRPTADEIRRTLRSGPQGVVPTPSYNDCRTKTRWDAGPYTYTMNRFNVCQVAGFIVEYWKEWWKGSRPFGKKLGTLRGHQLTYLDGKLNRREFYVRKHFYIDKVENEAGSSYDLGNAYIAFASTMGSKSSDCTRVSPASGTTVYKSVNSWKQDTATEWHSSELFTAGPGSGYHKISNCTINHAILSKSPVDFEESSTKIYALGTFRCDTSPMVRYHTGGGCVSSDAVPAFTISMNDVSSTGVPYKTIHEHIKKALTHPEDTVPQPGGPTFPDLTGKKSIPGGSEIRPLHRHGYEPIEDGNRSAAKTVCDEELGDRGEKMQCDEFPFASTLEGAARAKPFFNFSVAWINGSVNTSHGNILNAWYTNNRMLNSDPFWIQPLD